MNIFSSQNESVENSQWKIGTISVTAKYSWTKRLPLISDLPHSPYFKISIGRFSEQQVTFLLPRENAASGTVTRSSEIQDPEKFGTVSRVSSPSGNIRNQIHAKRYTPMQPASRVTWWRYPISGTKKVRRNSACIFNPRRGIEPQSRKKSRVL